MKERNNVGGIAVAVAAWHTVAGPCRALDAVLEALFAIETVCTSVCTCGGQSSCFKNDELCCARASVSVGGCKLMYDGVRL